MSASLPSESRHLVILRASRLEALVPELMHLLQTHPPDDVLEPQTVITAHPGMKHWLADAMARAAGIHGIVANIEVLLPGTWLQRQAQALGEAARQEPDPWSREVLRWAILAALEQAEAIGLDEPRVLHYLSQDGDADTGESTLRRFQLAAHLAALLAKYRVYRPDWLDAWERGQYPVSRGSGAVHASLESRLFTPLWRHLMAQLGLQRSRRMQQLLLQHVQAGTARTHPLHVFGFSHLAPAEHELLQAWARQAPVFLYLPDPCREYWGGLPTARVEAGHLAALRAWRHEEQARITQADEDEWLDPEQNRHPLLQRWGRLGQHFYASLAEWDSLADIRHGADLDNVEPRNMLERLQESIRRLDFNLLRTPAPFPARKADESTSDHDARVHDWWLPLRHDASLRAQACHTRLRELEVLRDALLHAVEEGIEPGRIVVMAPDIGQYAPLLPAVFGAAADPGERRLPWYLADVSALRGHRLSRVFSRLLMLGNSRLSLPELADLLAVPELARTIGLDPDALDTVLAWLDSSRAAWALDAEHRAEFGLAADPRYSLAWGLDRLLASHIFGQPFDPPQHIRLPDGSQSLPLPGVHNPDAAALGALDRLLCELQHWRELSRATHPASRWAQLLAERLDALLQPASDDTIAQASHAAVHRAIAQLALEPGLIGQDPALHFSVVRHTLLEHLERPPERQRFLSGGITFCGMVPQRAIPFDMVCVLGLNDEDFPRRAHDAGLDLMARQRRIGDRDVRSDDRWLFLETLMSARQRLHLSWIGQNARDGKARNPASPLAELLAALDQAAALGPDQTHPKAQPWRVQHPLQAFDRRYFDGHDPALFSYRAQYLQPRAKNAQAPAAFIAGTASPESPPQLPQQLSLHALKRYWKRPAQDLLERRLHLKLDALDGDSLRSSEPLEAQFERIETLARRVFFNGALAQGFDPNGTPRWDPAPIPDWIEHGGLMPPGQLGQRAWHTEAAAVLALLHRAHEKGLTPGLPQRLEIDIMLQLDPAHHLRLHGQVEQVLAHASGWQLVYPFSSKGALKQADALHLGERLPMFLDWAALRLHSAEHALRHHMPLPAVRLCVLAEGELDLEQELAQWDAALLETQTAQQNAMLQKLKTRLVALIHYWHQAEVEPPLYFPRSSQAVLQYTDKTPPAQKANEAFDGHRGERNHNAWNRLYARGIGFNTWTDAEAEHHAHALLHHAQTLQQLMRLSDPDTDPTPTHAAQAHA